MTFIIFERTKKKAENTSASIYISNKISESGEDFCLGIWHLFIASTGHRSVIIPNYVDYHLNLLFNLRGIVYKKEFFDLEQ